jgi:hypothetical protein
MILNNKKIKLVLFLLTLISCENSRKVKEVNFSNFNIRIPYEWQTRSFDGIDSKYLAIITSSKDTISIDNSRYSMKFDETLKVFSYEQIKKYDSLEMDTEDLKRSKTPSIDQNQGVFLNEYYYYEEIDKNLGKIRIPKKDKGIFGISFRNINESNKHLTIYVRDIGYEERKVLLKSFKTIKFGNGTD